MISILHEVAYWALPIESTHVFWYIDGRKSRWGNGWAKYL